MAYDILTSTWYILFAHSFLGDSNVDYEEDLYPSCSSEYKEIEGIFSALQVSFFCPMAISEPLTVVKPLRGQVVEKEE